MIDLRNNIENIEKLLGNGSPEALAYACLECRLAIELICYDRLRSSHEYISHDDLRRWQPHYVVNQLLEEVDDKISSSFTLSVAPEPVDTANPPETAEDYQKFEFVEVGKQVGFDPKYIGKLWQALSSFLHVRLPKNKTDYINSYGSDRDMRMKIEASLAEIKRIQSATLTSVWTQANISFQCNCGQANRRPEISLKDGKIVNCINPECIERFRVHVNKGTFEFEPVTIEVECSNCPHKSHFPERAFLELDRKSVVSFTCEACSYKNHVRWMLAKAEKAKPEIAE